MIPTPVDEQPTLSTPFILPTDSAGGAFIPERDLPGGGISPDPGVSGGSMEPDYPSSTAEVSPDSTEPGESVSPDSPIAGGVILPPQIRDLPLPANPGGPIIFSPSSTATGIQSPSGIIPGGPMKPPKRDEPLSFNPGGPMIPASAPASLETPSPVLPVPPIKGCTTTISETGRHPCSWNGIQTVYPSTTELYDYVNCHGCLDVYVHRPVYYCPMFVIDSVTTVTTPSTYWSTVCAPLTAVSQLTQTPEPTITGAPLTARTPDSAHQPRDLAAPAACPTTYVVQPPQSAGGTSTQYQRTVTQTVRLNCGGCPLVLSTALAGYGPAGRFTTTVTSPVRTTTAYVCA